MTGKLRKLEVVTKNRRRSWKGALILSGVVVLATMSVMVLVPTEQVLLEAGAMLAGLGVGAWFTRFGVPRRWMGSAVLLLFFALWFGLGTAGYAWFGGFFAGTLAGFAWGRVVANRTVQEAAAPWTVDAEGFATVEEARSAALAALGSLDGKNAGRLSVDHGSARFEVAGGVEPGMVCHRNADSTDENSWAVLQSAGAADESVEVPMGDVKAFMPARLVHDLASVEVALADFFKNPTESSFGPEWVMGNEAEGTRLTTH